MKIFFLPDVINGLIFDVDLTLYENREYYESMGPLMTERLAQVKNKSMLDMKAELDAVQKKYQTENGGRKLSIGNLFHRFGISFEENVRWRAELFQPEAYLSEDKQLIETMKQLQQRFKIAAVSNNATVIVERTLDVLGISGFFESAIGLDISLKSKPTMIPFNMTAEKLNLPVTEIVSIGDRVEIDLELPMQHGMGGILIEKIADVYQLPTHLLNAKNTTAYH